MNLSAEDTELYYRLRKSVLAYTNRQLAIIPKAATAQDVGKLPVAEVAKLGAAFYDNAELLGRYLDENPDHFPSGDLAIIASWKARISGDFYIMRFLKAYTVFMSAEPPRLYGVLGIQEPIEDVLAGAPLPILVSAVLLPFHNRIIYDGIMSLYRITFGGGVRGGLNQTYSRLKESEGIVEGLFSEDGKEQVRTSIARKLPAGPVPDWGPAIGAILVEVEKMRQTDTRLQGAALGLLRAAAGLAHAAFQEADTASRKMRSVRRAMTHLENLLREQSDW